MVDALAAADQLELSEDGMVTKTKETIEMTAITGTAQAALEAVERMVEIAEDKLGDPEMAIAMNLTDVRISKERFPKFREELTEVVEKFAEEHQNKRAQTSSAIVLGLGTPKPRRHAV